MCAAGFWTPSSFAGAGLWRPPAGNPFAALPNGAFYWSSVEETTAYNNNDPVSSISDLLYGSGATATSSLNARPLWKTGGVNGKPYLQFDGSDDILTFGAPIMAAGNVPYTLCVLYRPDLAGAFNNKTVMSFGNSSNVINETPCIRTTAGNQIWVGVGGNGANDLFYSTSANPYDKNMILVYRRSTSPNTIYGETVGEVTGSGSQALPVNLNVGTNNGLIGQSVGFSRYQGRIYALAVINSFISSEQVTAIQNYWRSANLYGSF